MTNLAWLLLAITGGLAAMDWIAVAAKAKRLEYVFKPAATAGLIAVALALHPNIEARRWAFVIALVFSLAGDVLLMLPKDLFIGGVAAFFAAHVAFIVGLRVEVTAMRPLLYATALVLLPAGIIGRRVLTGVSEHQPELRTPVTAYIAVICVMAASALASGNAYAATGALVFMASDSLIAWNRFVEPKSWANTVIMVTYHVGQAGLVLSLAL